MRNLVLAVALALVALLGAGCVMKSTFEKKAEEAASLSDRVAELVAEVARLEQEKQALTARVADLEAQLAEVTAQKAALAQDLERAGNDILRLEKVLTDRSAEAGAALAELRQTVDRLEAEKRTLQQELETEQVAREARIAHLKSTYDELVEKMESEISRGEVTISELQGRLTVNLVEKILFDSGKADLKPAGLEVLRRVGDILKGAEEKEIRIEGHTDNVPISPRLQQTFASNWELSSARAITVLHVLQDRVGIPGERLSACGFGAFRPVADNATAEGRAQNRRIQIVLVPVEGRLKEELDTEAAPAAGEAAPEGR